MPRNVVGTGHTGASFRRMRVGAAALADGKVRRGPYLFRRAPSEQEYQVRRIRYTSSESSTRALQDEGRSIPSGNEHITDAAYTLSAMCVWSWSGLT